MTPELRRYCQARKTAMVAERELYRPDWQQVADYIDPYAGRYLVTQQVTKKLPSRAKIINSEATRSARVMDAGFMGGHTSKSRPWFLLTVGDPLLKDRPNVKAWCDDVTQAIRDCLAKSNFYTALPSFYHHRHLFGVAALCADEDEKEIIRFYDRNIGTYAIGLDARGRVDSFHYQFERTARQIDQKYADKVGGREKLPQRVQDALANNRGDEKFYIDSLIEPNPDARKGAQASQFRAFRQIYWMDGGTAADQCGCLDMAGHYDNPVLASRWNATGNDCYGTSPALDALGDIKQLQYLEGEKLRILDQISKPALQLPDYLKNKGATLNPGGRIYVTPMQTQQEVRPVYTPDARGLEQVRQEIATVTERLKSTFFVDLFRMLDNLDDRERTAYELSERKEEKVAMLGPALESLTDEVLDPVVVRTFGIMDRAGRIPPPPEELNGVPLNIEYTSMLAQAMKAAGLGTIERTIGFVGNMVAAFQRPDLADKLDLEQAIDEYADRQGSPARIVRSDDDVVNIRSDRANAQKMQQMAAMAKPMSDAANAMKTMGEAVPQEGSAIEGMAGAMPGAAA